MVLVKILNDNPAITIELAAHTDSRASDEYNDELSQKRAETVVTFLIEKGINKQRLVAKGYGKRVPRILTTNITRDGYTFDQGTKLTEEYILSLSDVKKREAAYQLNRRTEFSVIGKNFK
jgi:peptidoglycan-associated lipoprotein